MRKIFKYPLIKSHNTIQMPDAKILDLHYQGPVLYLWAEVNPEAEPRNHTIRIFGTGNELPDQPRNYIGTVHDENGFVWHVFEML